MSAAGSVGFTPSCREHLLDLLASTVFACLVSVQISAYLSIYCKQSVCLFGISADLCNFGEMWLCHSRQISLEFISLEIVKTILKHAIPEWPLKMAPQWRRILEKVKVADCFTFLLFQPLFVSSHGGEVGASFFAGFFISSEIPVMPVFSSMSSVAAAHNQNHHACM